MLVFLSSYFARDARSQEPKYVCVYQLPACRRFYAPVSIYPLHCPPPLTPCTPFLYKFNAPVGFEYGKSIGECNTRESAVQACIPVRACKSLHKDCEPMSDLGICAPYFKCCLWQAAQQVTLFWQCDAMLFLFCISAELHRVMCQTCFLL